MKIRTIGSWMMILVLALTCAGFAEGAGDAATDYSTEAYGADSMPENGDDSAGVQIGTADDASGKEGEPALKMKIGTMDVTVAWEDNESVNTLKELAANGLSIPMSMYGGFEQVGSIGQRLPSRDVQTTTSSGDIVLYSGSQLVVFYGSNAWAYTRLGRITDKTPEEMRELLGNGDVTITLTLE